MDTNAKVHQPSPSSWDFYTTSIKEFLARPLTKREYSLMMNGYINSKPWQEMAKELEEV